MPAHLTLLLPPGAPDPAGGADHGRRLGAARVLPAPARAGYGHAAALCALFGVPTPADADVPVGAIGAAGELGATGNACWLRADPVLLAPTRVELRLVDGGPDALGADAAAALVAALETNACVPGARWHLATPQRWYVELAGPVQVATTPPAALVGWHVESGLPSGPDGPVWCAHLNLAQMIIHASAEAQDARGGAAHDVTGVWFWGSGPAPRVPAGRYAQVYADDPLARGLARLAGTEVLDVARFPELPALAGEVLLAPGAGDHQALLGRAVRARASGTLAGLDVVSVDPAGGATVHAVPARRRWWWSWPRR